MVIFMYFKPCNQKNYSNLERSKNTIKYIVVHYTAGNGDTARNNVDYFAREAVGASAHYFVDEKEVTCSVPWYYPAWHCGGSKLTKDAAFYGVCTNSNSIGVELCSRKANGEYYFKEETVNNAAAFVADLMQTYNIPIDRVIRHYDVTGKICPAPFVSDAAWAQFKERVKAVSCGKVVETVEYYEKLEDIPEGVLRNTVAELVENGIIKGDGSGLHLTYDMVRNLVFCKRMIDKGAK